MGVRWLVAGRAESFDIVAYSGRSTAHLRARHPRLLRLLDAVVTGPYQQDRPTELAWQGSANQELVALSERGTRIAAEQAAAPAPRRLQVSVEEGRVWMVGVPRPTCSPS